MSQSPGALRARLLGLRAELVAFYRALPREPLSTRERKACAVLLDADSARFVRRTAEALGEGGLFGDLPVDAADLSERQALADVARDLRGHFHLLGRLCGDLYLELEAGAVRDALSAVQQVRAEAQMPLSQHPRHEDRALALGYAASLAPR